MPYYISSSQNYKQKMTGPKNQLIALLRRHIARISRKINYLSQWSTRFSYIRLGYFLAGMAIVFVSSDFLNDFFFFLLCLFLFGGFILLVKQHTKIRNMADTLTVLREIKNEHLARMELNWEHIANYQFAPQIKNHPYGSDFNITGNQSLHHLLDTAIYEGGSAKLADWLLHTQPDARRIAERRKLVEQLTPLGVFRDRLRVKARRSIQEISEKDWPLERLMTWMRATHAAKYKTPLAILCALSAVNIVLAILAILGIIGPYVVFSILLYLGIYNANSHKIKGLFDAAFQINKQLERLGHLFLYVERFEFHNKPELQAFLHHFKNDREKPSRLLKKAQKLGAAASLQKNQVLWPLVNFVIPWDLYFSMKMEQLKQELEPKLSQWLSTFYELEALNSLANFAALNPHYNPAELLQNDDELLFDAEMVGHPLIPDSVNVRNDFRITNNQKLFLVTGSNMAGKSTFLRTVGINLCLAFAGAPVNAKHLSTRIFRLFTSINVVDSLGEGLSHFYAEVRRLKQLMVELEREDEPPLFFFVDEIFRGTNNRERLLGSSAFLKNVAGKNGIGLVTTHDLELAGLEKEIPDFSNLHFSETIKDGKMYFEYRLKKGPCQTTNALKIMEMEGLPVV